MSEQAPRFEYTPEQEAEMAASSAAQDTAAQTEQSSQFLLGPRKVGDVPMAAGGFERHAISGDGMKYTRNHGERYASASDFHRQAGVAQDYEMEDQPKQETRRSRAGQAIGRILGRSR